MRGSIARRSWWPGAALVAVGMAAGCSVYQPLDQGSGVPWAVVRPAVEREVVAGMTTPAAVARSGESYQVRRGDRLGGLAESFGVSVADLAQANRLHPPYVIRVGQVLRLPAHASGGAAEPVAVVKPVPAEEIASILPDGTTAGSGANDEVKAKPAKLAALEVTPIPRPVKHPPASSAESGPVPRLKPDDTAAPGTAKPRAADRYTVRSGETLSGIARRLDVGLSALADANDIDQPYRIYTGQKLRVPHRYAHKTTTVDLGDDRPQTVRLATGEPPPLKGDDFLWPVNGKVIGKYGPIDQWRRRDGIDIAARRGAPVLAAQDGIVAYAGDGIRGYGQMILLRHDQGYITTYAHNASLLVGVGDIVRRGQVIARVGDSGDATQSMLHFELRKGRKPIDPATRLVVDDTALASTTQ